MNLATNRQKKVLRFFGIDFGSDLSIGAAGWEIDNLFCSEENFYYWNKYLYLTKDYDVDSDSLIEFDLEEFNSTNLPLDWNGRDEVKKFQDELVKNIISDASPYDNPPPQIVTEAKSFCFTGKFEIGTRKLCQEIIERSGGSPEKGVTGNLDYLVIGTKGSSCWARGEYGNKIQKAILLRRQNGKPAIVSEKHCFDSIK